MKLTSSNRFLRCQAFSLMEAMAYISLFVVVAGLAFSLFYRTEEQSRGLRRSADDMTGILNAGERWRADIRAATALPEPSEGALRIPRQNEVVTYYLRENALWRTVGESKPVRLAVHVKTAAFEKEQRQFVTAWRCNIELQTKKQGRIRPLFTFLAVPEKGATR